MAPTFPLGGVILLYYKVEANKQKTDKCYSILPEKWIIKKKTEDRETLTQVPMLKKALKK